MAASDFIAILLLAIAAYAAGLLFFRAFLHPLARVPGPRLAAVTGWYEFYYDCLKHGQYAFRVQELHKQYGKSNAMAVCDAFIDVHDPQDPLCASARGRST